MPGLLLAALRVGSLLVLGAPALAGDDYTGSIAPGLHPRLTAATVADLVGAGGSAAPAGVRRITALECVRGDDIGRAGSTAPFWIVRVEGHFVNLRTPPGCPAQVAPEGFYVIDDATGSMVARGFVGGRFTGPCDRLQKGR
ncbi:MAG: hypothetical protein OZ948_00435 [Deltaproteobacteria bacterium]|nr:hypothetical protein [Deltaproteobacteria bacterium]